MSNGVVIGSIIVSAIAAIGGWLSARESRKANTTNTVASGRVEMEKEAYERARKLDTDTIERQEEELEELRTNQKALIEKVKKVDEENTQVLAESQKVLRENARLREINRDVLEDNQTLRTELQQLRLRVTRIQRGVPPGSVEPIRERETDTEPMGAYRDGGK